MPDTFPLLIICVIGVTLRLALLNQPMRYDETLTFIGYASRPLWQALTDYSAPNNHLFHTLLVHLTTLFGTQYSEWMIRVPAFAAGAAVIPAASGVTWAAGAATPAAAVTSDPDKGQAPAGKSGGHLEAVSHCSRISVVSTEQDER